jgi:hypothetical protein
MKFCDFIYAFIFENSIIRHQIGKLKYSIGRKCSFQSENGVKAQTDRQSHLHPTDCCPSKIVEVKIKELKRGGIVGKAMLVYGRALHARKD